MLFNSFPFIFCFLPLAVLGFYLLGRFSHQLAGLWLCAASLYFYSQWNSHYVWLLLISITVNYGFGYGIARLGHSRARALLIVAIVFNLLLLGYYKYAGFFIHAFDSVLGTGWSLGQIILPLGISFFTFTQITFLVDSYKGKAREYNFVHYLLFVTYFPHLIAGPILHHAQMMPQFALRQTYRINWENKTRGLMVFTVGLAKKILLADTFSAYVTPVFDSAHTGATPLLLESWIAVLAFALQLYFDFSGYCDMAVGISYLFNIKLPLNFNSPYKAANIIDFWRRWHMTLSAFLRDYLYIPLGGNRHGKARRWFNVMATMLLGGLWHGAGWTFVIWGGLHGIYLVINHAFQNLRQRMGWDEGRWGWRGRILSTAATFLAVTVAWVFFRSPDLKTAGHMLSGMIGGNPLTWHAKTHLDHYFSVYFGLLAVWLLPNTQQWLRLRQGDEKEPGLKSEPSGWLEWNPDRWWNWVLPGIVLAIAILMLTNGKPSEFLYFQF
ncbi:MAG: MBOAT family protein [Methylacidiphilales bacterium]|nr:MBOAT family protein [Candidatus Methylacidiphilales bacterium]